MSGHLLTVSIWANRPYFPGSAFGAGLTENLYLFWLTVGNPFSKITLIALTRNSEEDSLLIFFVGVVTEVVKRYGAVTKREVPWFALSFEEY